MNTEYELRILEIDVDDFIYKIEKLGATKLGSYFQRRYVYDFNPKISNKWIRLRSNGEKTTLTIKEVQDKTIDGTKELEIEVSDFDTTNLILKELGYQRRAYHENKRITYILNGVEIDIDTWPMIPTYVELEGTNTESIYQLVEEIDIPKDKITELDVESIYEEIYQIKINDILDLKFS